jgi:hypothetical protein
MQAIQYGNAHIVRTIGGTATQITGGKHWGNGTGDPYYIFSNWVFDEPNTTSQIQYRLHVGRHSSGSIIVNDIGSYNSLNGGIKITVFELDGSTVTNTTS